MCIMVVAVCVCVRNNEQIEKPPKLALNNHFSCRAHRALLYFSALSLFHSTPQSSNVFKLTVNYECFVSSFIMGPINVYYVQLKYHPKIPRIKRANNSAEIIICYLHF